MIGGEAARNAGELVAFQIAEKLAHWTRSEDATEFVVALGNVLANGQQVSGLRHVHASANSNSLVRDCEVIATLVVRCAAPAEGGGNLLFVRFLVLAESNVAIDAKDGFVRIGFVFGSEIEEGEVQRIHQLAHRLFDFFFKERLARQKPFSTVVAREPTEEL